MDRPTHNPPPHRPRQQTLASGSRDRCIHLHDTRAREPYTARLQAHRQEVCGLRWSFDDAQLASGGNDNKLYVWSPAALGNGPVQRFTDHTAAVKAIAWSPHQNSLLASGGGTADRCIRFWNTATGTALSAVDTGSQVCNLMWSRTVNEIVSTHGYSLNQIILWRYPIMSKVATLTGHTYRCALGPGGCSRERERERERERTDQKKRDTSNAAPHVNVGLNDGNRHRLHLLLRFFFCSSRSPSSLQPAACVHPKPFRWPSFSS